MSKSGKGSTFERELSKLLSLWWTGGVRDDVIWRTSQSGGRATQRAKSGLRTKYSYGDLTFTDPAAQPLFDLLVISAKRGYTNTSKPLQKKDLDRFCTSLLEFEGAFRSKDFRTTAKKEVSKLFSKTKKTGGIDLLDTIDKPDKKDTLARWIQECHRDVELAQVFSWWLLFRRDGCRTCCVMPAGLHRELSELRLNNRTSLPDSGAPCAALHTATGGYVVAALVDVLGWCSPKAVTHLAKKWSGKAGRVSHG